MEASCQGSSNPIGQQQHEEEDEEIKICVKIIKTVSLKISKLETVGGLKALVCKNEGIPEPLQELFVNGNHLKNGKTMLVDYGIRSNTSVSAYVGNSELLWLTIMTLSRKIPITVGVKPQDTVKNIKALIEDSVNMVLDDYSLVYDGKIMLEEEKTLAFLGITNRSTLYVVSNPGDVLQISLKRLNGETVKTQV